MATRSHDAAISALSLRDLSEARDAYHVHLVNQPNVVATAIGRYLVRRGEYRPTAPRIGDVLDRRPGTSSPRTLPESVVASWSWPCVLVFVNHWMTRDE